MHCKAALTYTDTTASSKLSSPCRWRHTGCRACISCSSAGALAGLQLHAGCKRKALLSEASEGGLLHFGLTVNDSSHGLGRCGGASSAWAELPVHCTAERGSWRCGMWGRGARSWLAQEGQQGRLSTVEQREVQRWWARYPTGTLQPLQSQLLAVFTCATGSRRGDGDALADGQAACLEGNAVGATDGRASQREGAGAIALLRQRRRCCERQRQHCEGRKC